MTVHLYRQMPVQLEIPGFGMNAARMSGLNLGPEKQRYLDGELCDVAVRETRGRLHGKLQEDELRTPFERDTQRISTSEIFQRTIGKTQVFPLPMDPTVRNRMTHAMEVARISRSIAIFLRLNPDLAEAIGYAHDVGHSPFGHAGEAVLDRIRQRMLGLYHKHNIQGLITIDDLYRNRDSGEPIDATFETRDGIVCHLGETSESEIIPWGAYKGEEPKSLDLAVLKRGDIKVLEEHRISFPSTLEGCVVRLSDRISSVARDPEDAVKHGIISWSDLPELCQKVFRNHDGQLNASSIIKTLVRSVILNSWDPTHHTIYSIRVGDRESRALNELYAFNFDKIYRHPTVTANFLYFVPYIVEILYLDYTISDDNPLHRKMSPQEAIDHISYMTDREAITEMERVKKTKFKLDPIV